MTEKLVIKKVFNVFCLTKMLKDQKSTFNLCNRFLENSKINLMAAFFKVAVIF